MTHVGDPHEQTPDMSGIRSPEQMTAREAAARAGVNERTIRRAIASGVLSARKEGSAFAIAASDLDRWQRGRETAIRPDRGLESQRTHSEATPRSHAPLPRPASSLVSRDHEAAAATDLLRREDVRLVSLTGPGGVGKTRLAIRVAEDLDSSYADGVWFVPLAGVSDPALVVDAISSTLGIATTSGQSPREALHAFLADRQGLLVLDNLEQVIDAAPDVSDMLAACPGLSILVTSRVLLRLAGEHAVPVPPLDFAAGANDGVNVAPAVRLFVERAKALVPGFALDAESVPVVEEICRLVDGLPLAIELAAARVPSMSLQILRDRLRQQLAVLTTGMRDAPRRHRTMRDAIAWSYELLTAGEKDALRALSVFAGGFTEAAAASVAGWAPDGGTGSYGSEPSFVDLVGSLIDKSLIRRVDRDDRGYRFEMLETIRAFGLERLSASGEERVVRDRHADWMIAFVRSQLDGWGYIPEIGTDNLSTFLAVEAEQDNVRAALGWLESQGDAHRMLLLGVAMHAFWELRGTHDEVVSWLERGLALGDDVPVAVLLGTHQTIGRKRQRQGRLDVAWTQYQAAHALAVSVRDASAEAHAIYALGGVATNRGDFALAEELLLDALHHYAALGDDTGICGVKYFLGVVYLQSDRPEESLAALGASLDIRHRHSGVVFQESVILNALGFAFCATDDIDSAEATARESMELWQRGQGASEEVLAEWLGLASVIAFRRDRPKRAAWILGAAHALTVSLGMPLVLGSPDQRVAYEAALCAMLGAETYAAQREAGAMASMFDVSLLDAGEDSTSEPERDDRSPLTSREQEVLELLVAGLRDREIAEALYISVRTVEGHVARVIQKLGARSRTGALATAIALGLVPASPARST